MFSREPAQFGFARSRPGGDEVGDQIRIAGGIVLQGHDDRLQAGMVRDDAFDLTELDAGPANLHLAVAPAEELDVAVGQEAGDVAGSVQAPSAVPAWGSATNL